MRDQRLPLALYLGLALALAPHSGSAADPSALPAWVDAKRQAASDVPDAKRRAAVMWNRTHAKAVDPATPQDAALDAARMALSIARDNLGENHIATIISATDLGQLEGRAGHVEAAETAFTTALASADAVLGNGHPETLRIRGLAAQMYEANGLFAKAREYRTANVANAGTALGRTHPLTLAAKQALVQSDLTAGRLEAAAGVLPGLCATTRKILGDSHLDSLHCLGLSADLARERGLFPDAVTAYDKALAGLPASDPAVPGLQAGRGETFRAQGRLAEARTALEPLTSWRAKADLAEVLSDQDDLEAAEKLAAEVLDHATKTLGPDHPQTLAATGTLAAIHRKQGRLAEAENGFATAYAGYHKILGDSHPATAVAAGNLGEILEKEGLFDQAEPPLRAAFDSEHKIYGDTHPTTLAGMNNLALLYESQGLFDRAEPLYKTVAATEAKMSGPRHPEAAAADNNLAYLYLLQGRYADAAPRFRAVHEAWKKTLGPTHQDTLKALNNLARAEAGAGHVKEAETLFDQALAARRAALGPNHLDTLRSMHDLAALYRQTKRFDKALALLKVTLATDEIVLGPSHPYTFEVLNTLAGVQEDLGDVDAALTTRRTIFERRNIFYERMLPVTGDNAREGYVRLHAPELADYVNALLKKSEAVSGKGMLDVTVARKGLLLSVASQIQQITRLSRDPEMAKLAGQLELARKKLAALTLSGPTPETHEHHLEVMADLEDQIHRLEGDLGRASQRFREQVAPVTAEQVAAALPDDAVLVDFFTLGEGSARRLVAGAVHKEDGKPVYQTVVYDHAADIDAAILKYRADIQNEDIELDDLQDSGQAVYGRIWQPLERVIGKRTNVYVVPDGTLNILPFAALVEKNGRYLMERIDLHILGSARDLLPTHVPPAKGGFVVAAGPDYNLDILADKTTVETLKRRSATVQESMRGLASGMRGLHFDPLPGAEREGRLIEKTIQASTPEGDARQSVLFSKADAQEQVLRDRADPPEFLHIATHGFFLKPDDSLRRRLLALQRSGGNDLPVPPPGDNPLLRSGLAFAGINANAPVLGEIDTDNDGVLTALEVLGLDLSGTRLAILSACETGLGEIHEGEGVYGLRRAFQEAGAQSVISSLWEVSDAGTQTLMAALYKRLMAGVAPHQALRETQLEMLRNPQWSAPYIWSAFYMVGA